MALGLVAALVLAVMASTRSSDPVPQRGGESAKATSPLTRPCDGHVESFNQATRELPYELLIPNTELASQSSLKATWSCDDIGQIALEYESGVVVYERLSDLADPAATYAALAKEYPEYSTGEVRGVPASLAAPDPKQGVSGGVDFVVGDARYIVAGDETIPLDALREVAESMRPVEGG